MGENAGAAILALALGLLGFGLIVAGVRGTYGNVWAAARSLPPGGEGKTDTGIQTGSGAPTNTGPEGG